MEPTQEQIEAAMAARSKHEYTTTREMKVSGQRWITAYYCICGLDISASNFWAHQMEEILKAVFNLQAEKNKQRLAQKQEPYVHKSEAQLRREAEEKRPSFGSHSRGSEGGCYD